MEKKVAEIRAKIVKEAKKYIGQKEIKGNKGWHDEEFQSRMERIGWKYGHQWCSYFAELVWVDAYSDNPEMLKFIKKNCSGSSYRTMTKFEASGYPISKIPIVGSIIIWRKKKSGEYTTLGHVGILIEAHENHFISVEGNTNDAGSRDGEVVALKRRTYTWEKSNGLELAGFLHPITKLKEPVPEIPFKSRLEGNKFREWVNDEYPDIAKEIDLDRSGSYNNSYIKKAWYMLHDKYKK